MRGRRTHGIEAAGAGDVGAIDVGVPIGPCPSCGAALSATRVLNPHTRRVDRALVHPVPFCTYFGEASPDEIERAIGEAAS